MSRRGSLIAWSRKPAEDTEKRCQNIDPKNGDDKLQRRICLPSAGDENQPIFSQGDLQEEDFLNVAVVLNESSAWKEERTTHDPGCECQKNTEHDGDNPDLGQLPFHGACFVMCIVIGDGDGSQIGKQSQENDQIDTDGFINNDHRGDKVDFQVEAKSDTILNISLRTIQSALPIQVLGS